MALCMASCLGPFRVKNISFSHPFRKLGVPRVTSTRNPQSYSFGLFIARIGKLLPQISLSPLKSSNTVSALWAIYLSIISLIPPLDEEATEGRRVGGRSEKQPEILTRALGGVVTEAKISFPRKEVFPGRRDQAWSNDHFVWIFRFTRVVICTWQR